MKQRLWHTLTAEQVLDLLDTDRARGLTEAEARKRQRKYGPNLLKEQRRVSAWKILIGQFRDFMVLVLLGATLISYLMGEIGDAVTIVAIVVLNAFLGFFQEYRAERSIEALKQLAAPRARVRREGKETQIPAAELVPGDILLLETGDRVPCDARLLEASNLEVQEAALTGESQPVTKNLLVCEEGSLPLGDRRNMVYMGTAIARGRGLAVVVATGMATEMGLIAGMLQEAEEEPTPLQIRLEQLGKYLVWACLLISLVVTVTGILRGEPPYKMFLAGVSLAVAAIPEGLPAIVTIALALGVQRMIKAQAIVRRLPAVETLGCATVICSDKTGTLTRNAMTVRSLYTGGEEYQVSGQGYEPRGKFISGERVIQPRGNRNLQLTLSAAALCCNARLEGKMPPRLWPWRRRRGEEETGCWEMQGDPTEGALLVAAAKAGLWREDLDRVQPRVAEIPFESERRLMSVICRVENGAYRVYTKGAPDTVIALCNSVYRDGRQLPLGPAERKVIMQVTEEMASRALRVLGIAYREIPALPARIEAGEVEKDLVFLGLAGMIDPPRPEAREAIRKCHQAGIRTVMITGDHGATATAIARELDLLPPGGMVVTGRELDEMSDRALAQAAERIYVYARVSPGHKLRIVRALRQRGHVVAMTGDGVNDAPAVKEADIGVAMGLTGTDVTKEASAMILADDNFATIVAAVEQGRAIYDNIRKFIRYLLACNVGEVLVMFLAAVTAMPLPLVPIQILWVNLVTDGLPAMALGVDRPEPDVMRRPPRRPRESIFSRGLARKILGRGLLIGVGTLGVFAWGLAVTGGNLLEARTMAFATLVMSQLFHVFDCRSERSSVLDMGLFTNPLLVGAVAVSTGMLLAVIYLPGLRPAFQTHPLNVWEWMVILAVAGSGAIMIGLRRAILYRNLGRTSMMGGRT